MKKLVSMTSTHGKTPAEVAEELIAAVQKFRDTSGDTARAVTEDAPARDQDAPNGQ